MKLLKKLREALPLLLLLAGAAAVAVGVWLIFKPAGYIAGGMLLMAVAVMMIRGEDNEQDKT